MGNQINFWYHLFLGLVSVNLRVSVKDRVSRFSKIALDPI
ncbi:unnamed protein product, partial [Vitis vinifera]|uniref:Uncharacterized protein n=1 Tax=Vitis vinifera TaxID=29760 RepID=D7SRP4_VITVI